MKGFSVALLCICTVFFISPAGICADDAGERVTLREFVSKVVQRDSEFEGILLDELRLQYSKELKLPAKDIVVSVRQTYDMFIDGTNAWATAVGLDKLFPLSATKLSGRYSIEPSSSGSGDTSGALGIDLSQSVARNAFGRSTRMLDRIVGLETNVAQHQVVEAYEDYLASVISSFHTWSRAYEELKVSRSSYEENVKLLDNIRERQKKQIAKAVDVNKITLQVAGRKESLIELEETYAQQQGVISRMLRRDDVGALVPVTPEPDVLKGDSFPELFTNLYATARTFQILHLLETKSGLEVDREADDLLPSVDLVLGIEMTGEGGDLSERQDMVFAGLKMAWPVPDQKNRAELKDARLDLRAAELRSVNVRYRLYSNLLRLYHELKKERRLTEVAEEKIRLAQAIVRDERENYSFGRVTLNDYIQAVNSLDNARFGRIRHETLYRLLLTEWRRLTDTLVAPKDIYRPASPK